MMERREGEATRGCIVSKTMKFWMKTIKEKREKKETRQDKTRQGKARQDGAGKE